MPPLIKRPVPPALVIQSVLVASLSGCTGAPDVILVGTYFPAWLFCAVVGIIGGTVARILFVITHVTELLPHQLTVCSGIGVIVATGTWLLFFR